MANIWLCIKLAYYFLSNKKVQCILVYSGKKEVNSLLGKGWDRGDLCRTTANYIILPKTQVPPLHVLDTKYNLDLLEFYIK